MNSEIVYQVAKALPREEQWLLLEKLKKDFEIKQDNFKVKKQKFSKQDAIHYLLNNVFKK